MRRCAGWGGERRELAPDFRGHGYHLIAHSQIERKVTAKTPVVLQIAAEEGLAIGPPRRGLN